MSLGTVVILAAGRGTRMRSSTPKLAHDLCGRPLLGWPVAAAREAGADSVVVVVSAAGGLEDVIPDGVRAAVQDQPNGTGGAVLAAGGLIDPAAPVIVLAGDVPLIEAELLRRLAAAHASTDADATMVTVELDDPRGYGRVVRDPGGMVERVVETKHEDGLAADVLALTEVNTGVFAFSPAVLLDHLRHIEPVAGEIYLPSVLPLIRAAGGRVETLAAADSTLLAGVNDRVQLAAVRAECQRRIFARHMAAGVTIVQPASTCIDVAVEIGADTVVEPCTQLLGATSIGSGATIGPHATVIASRLGDGVRVVHSHLIDCELRAGASAGPFAYLRPGALLREGAKAGTFVEIKNSDIGEGTKVPHLSYVGDADVGAGTNLGAGTITANYDYVKKNRTRIGSRVKGGVHTSYIAPVAVDDDAWTAAGSVINHDVPAGALGVARARQRNVEGYDERRSDGGDV